MVARFVAYTIVILFFAYFTLTPALAVLKVMAKMGTQFAR